MSDSRVEIHIHRGEAPDGTDLGAALTEIIDALVRFAQSENGREPDFNDRTDSLDRLIECLTSARRAINEPPVNLQALAKRHGIHTSGDVVL